MTERKISSVSSTRHHSTDDVLGMKAGSQHDIHQTFDRLINLIPIQLKRLKPVWVLELDRIRCSDLWRSTQRAVSFSHRSLATLACFQTERLTFRIRRRGDTSAGIRGERQVRSGGEGAAEDLKETGMAGEELVNKGIRTRTQT